MGDTFDPDAEELENGRRQFAEPHGEDREGKDREPYVDVETVIVAYGSRQAFHDHFDKGIGIRCPPHYHELWHVDAVEFRQAGQLTSRRAYAK